MTCAYIVLLGAGYLWVYLPWKVVRKDQAALQQAFTALQERVTAEMKLRKTMMVTDEDQFRAEARTAARRLLREESH